MLCVHLLGMPEDNTACMTIWGKQVETESLSLSSGRPHLSNCSFPDKWSTKESCVAFSHLAVWNRILQVVPLCWLQEGCPSTFANRAAGQTRLSTYSTYKPEFQRCEEHRFFLPLLNLLKWRCFVLNKVLTSCPGEDLLRLWSWCEFCGQECLLHLTALCVLKIFLPW